MRSKWEKYVKALSFRLSMVTWFWVVQWQWKSGSPTYSPMVFIYSKYRLFSTKWILECWRTRFSSRESLDEGSQATKTIAPLSLPCKSQSYQGSISTKLEMASHSASPLWLTIVKSDSTTWYYGGLLFLFPHNNMLC